MTGRPEDRKHPSRDGLPDANGRPTRGEFGRIADYLAPLASGFPGAFALKDDAAILTHDPGTGLAVTTDTIVAGTHFIGKESPRDLAWKLLGVNLSDLAAKGAKPRWWFFNMCLPRGTDDTWVEEFTAAAAEVQKFYPPLTLAGGDSVSTDGPAVLTATLVGQVDTSRPLLRSGAKLGDEVYVTGTIGDGALGLMVEQGALSGLPKAYADYLSARYLRPSPRIAFGRLLPGLASACLDVSDGLVADAGHISECSGVAVEIEANRIPLSDAAAEVIADDPCKFADVLGGGDDYELLFTAPDGLGDRIAQIAQDSGVAATRIGRIVKGSGVRVVDASGAPLEIGHAGYVHG